MLKNVIQNGTRIDDHRRRVKLYRYRELGTLEYRRFKLNFQQARKDANEARSTKTALNDARNKKLPLDEDFNRRRVYARDKNKNKIKNGRCAAKLRRLFVNARRHRTRLLRNLYSEMTSERMIES
ncbi:hypothetical protein PUN28_017554 [Cardiocondyla obscurior]|uniref:Uncharacterized protein n=1 Tax=Cardiocondyla obscurior TaxID=286306 RepID=A0AAW2ELW9_9HYME